MKTIKQAVLETIEQRLTEQTDKGSAKYGQSLDEVPVHAYDWNLMAAEEMIDGLQYQQMEIKKLRRLNSILEDENKKLKWELKMR
ncbi:hypothetical protein BN1080_02094 [Planococcus massiliensis]|uniref:Uncharacterized protein n=1 Tax=Planococcus massiliensis TaxID=1499687 RepID=A0A098EMV4_9BACL|nr:hypothetical protein [Planococcus massiliensis]CEG23150.1 hypothetical protein BN1080_02094 [Planococcus massiliensis]